MYIANKLYQLTQTCHKDWVYIKQETQFFLNMEKEKTILGHDIVSGNAL